MVLYQPSPLVLYSLFLVLKQLTDEFSASLRFHFSDLQLFLPAIFRWIVLQKDVLMQHQLCVCLHPKFVMGAWGKNFLTKVPLPALEWVFNPRFACNSVLAGVPLRCWKEGFGRSVKLNVILKLYVVGIRVCFAKRCPWDQSVFCLKWREWRGAVILFFLENSTFWWLSIFLVSTPCLLQIQEWFRKRIDSTGLLPFW